MLLVLFNKKVEESYGVRLSEVPHEEGKVITLKAPISRTKAHKRASKAPLLQFRDFEKGDHGDVDTLTHTGYVRVRKDASAESQSYPYQFLPLSAALRVSQKDDVESGRIEEGSIHPAVVFDYDVAGDSGAPLLILSLNPGGTREALRMKPDRKYTPIDHPQHILSELKVGDGPLIAKVVRLLPGKALIDCEVGRKVSAEGMVKVFGILRFQDSLELPTKEREEEAIMDFEGEDCYGTNDISDLSIDDLDTEADFDSNYEEDEEEEDDDDDDELADDLLALRDETSLEEGLFEEDEEVEDITHMFKMNEDGSMSYTDPENGETIVLDFDEDDDDEENEVDDDNVKDLRDVRSSEDDLKKRSEGKGFLVQNQAPASRSKRTYRTKPLDSFLSRKSLQKKRLRVGDEVKVYIRSVSKQSNQFTVTTNQDVRGRKARELKKEGDAQKKLQRLEKQLGGSLQRIFDLQGQECDGTVRATSQTGDWVYVQPFINGLPIGVARLHEDIKTVETGDSVRVRLEGIDAERGQIAMQVLSKLSP